MTCFGQPEPDEIEIVLKTSTDIFTGTLAIHIYSVSEHLVELMDLSSNFVLTAMV